MAKNNRIYFTAQTGVWKLKPPKAPSNYHVYELMFSNLGKIQMAVGAAKVGSSGLEYPKEFLKWLKENDLS